jgi:hypothetical protein
VTDITNEQIKADGIELHEALHKFAEAVSRFTKQPYKQFVQGINLTIKYKIFIPATNTN